MDLDTLIVTVFCWLDEAIPSVLAGQRLRPRGPQPQLTDAEVVTMEVVGEYLGLEHDTAVFGYFRRHFGHFFPAVRGGSTARPLLAKRLTCGTSKNGGGSIAGARSATIRGSR